MFLGAIIGAIGGAISSAIGCIGSAIGSIGSALASFASSALSVLGNLGIGSIFSVVQGISSVIHIVSSILGISNPDMPPEELGERAFNSDKKPEDFDSYKEYIEHLKTVEFDQKAFDALTPDQKLARKIVGTTIEGSAIGEEKDTEIGLGTLVAIGKLNASGMDIDGSKLPEGAEHISADKFLNLLDTVKGKDIEMDDVADYLQGKETSNDTEVFNTLSEFLGEDSTKKILDLQDAVRNIENNDNKSDDSKSDL